MKTSMKLFLGLIQMSFAFQGLAQKPEPVYSVVRQIHDFDWYEKQAKAWKQEIDNGTTNTMAWHYWFEANRMAANFCDLKKWESKKGDYFVDRKKIIELAEKAIPNSFELNYMKIYDDRAGSGTGEAFIMNAQQIRPYDRLLFSWLVNLYLNKNDKVNLELTCKKWFDSNEMPQELLITAYNNLISLDQNAILVTNGDNDTYPYWVLQQAKGIRTDVLVINASLALNQDYRIWTFKEFGIPQINLLNDSNLTSDKIFKHLVENVSNKPIYISIFVGEKVFTDYADKTYLTGLSYKYSAKPFDNIAELRNNIENKYMLDFLKYSFYNNYAQSMVNLVNGNYLVIFMKLYEHYVLSGESAKAAKMKELAKTVATNTGNPNWATHWMKYFDK